MIRHAGFAGYSAPRAGFTLVELVLTVVILGMLAAVMTPRVADMLRRAGARQAAGVLATDLESAVSYAARARVPIRISCQCAQGVLEFSNRNTGAIIRRRHFTGSSGGYFVQSLSLSAASTDVYPNGLTSGPLTVTLATPAGTRQVTMSTAGFVRVLP